MNEFKSSKHCIVTIQQVVVLHATGVRSCARGVPHRRCLAKAAVSVDGSIAACLSTGWIAREPASGYLSMERARQQQQILQLKRLNAADNGGERNYFKLNALEAAYLVWTGFDRRLVRSKPRSATDRASWAMSARTTSRRRATIHNERFRLAASYEEASLRNVERAGE